MNEIHITQQQNLATNQKKQELLFYLVLFTGMFLLLEIAYSIWCSGFYFGDVEVVADHFQIPLKVVFVFIAFVLIQLLLHFLFSLVVWLQALSIGKLFRLSWVATEKTAFIGWGVSLLTLLLLNEHFYPLSKFASLTEIFIPWGISGVLAAVFSIVSMSGVVLIVLSYFTSPHPPRKKHVSTSPTNGRGDMIYSPLPERFLRLGEGLGMRGFIFILFLIPVLFYYLHTDKQHTYISAATEDQPNIILIGVDSLRPDFVGYFGSTGSTPSIDNFLDQATVFAETLTPLARTFPAWTSMLTGEYPKRNGARTNLEDPQHIDLRYTLPRILQQHGYQTIFATDETRFSNIDKSFGFDKLVTPPMGVSDFLIGALNDFPFSNLLVNTRLGEIIFPYSFANRPAYSTYDPNSFLRLLRPMVLSAHSKPVFMVVHFCLPHHPYVWGTEAVTTSKSVAQYRLAVNRADQQFGDFFQMLQQSGLLQHAVVVLLSDHGEALELKGDRATDPELFVANQKGEAIPRFYPPMLENEKVDESAGHGTDVLGLTQYHTVFAWRTFGKRLNHVQVVKGYASLLDIKPTVLSLLNLPLQQLDGMSLQAQLLGSESEIHSRGDLFTESDFSPIAIRTVHPETRDVVLSGLNYFNIDQKSARVVVKDAMEKLIISSKQFADFYGDWALALYPQKNNTMTPILLNLRNGRWTNNLQLSFAQHSPAQHMLAALQRFYGSDLKPVQTNSLEK